MKALILSMLLLTLPDATLLKTSFFQDDKVPVQGKVIDADTQQALVGATISVKGANKHQTTGSYGNFKLFLKPGSYIFEIKSVGYKGKSKKIAVPESGLKNHIFTLDPSTKIEVFNEETASLDGPPHLPPATVQSKIHGISIGSYPSYPPINIQNNEEYADISENTFQWASKTPLSTFSIDVDGASYSNVRRMIMDVRLPVKNAVRVEELINYFNYDYEFPKNEHPFSVNSEVGPAPWNPKHQLVQIGIQGEHIEAENLPPSNLVFLLDVSGSMNSHNKLPLLKKGFKLLTNQLREEDYVSIVVYAGNSGLVLPPTSGADKEAILETLNKLNAGRSCWNQTSLSSC